jgi:hypothetical protein
MGVTANNSLVRFELRYARSEKTKVCHKCGVAFVEQEFIYRKRTGGHSGNRVKAYHQKCWEKTQN